MIYSSHMNSVTWTRNTLKQHELLPLNSDLQGRNFTEESHAGMPEGREARVEE